MVLLRKYTVASPHGAMTIFGEYGDIVESDILTCAHCQYTWRVVHGSGIKRGICKRCSGFICGKPKCMSQCVTIEEQLERGQFI